MSTPVTYENGRSSCGSMERVTVRIYEEDLEAVDQLVDTGEYPTRCEAIRAAVRKLIEEKD